jgi:hypothetical protein
VHRGEGRHCGGEKMSRAHRSGHRQGRICQGFGGEGKCLTVVMTDDLAGVTEAHRLVEYPLTGDDTECDAGSSAQPQEQQGHQCGDNTRGDNGENTRQMTTCKQVGENSTPDTHYGEHQ